MRKLALLALSILVLVAALLLARSGKRLYTTRSATAYALFREAQQELYVLDYAAADSLLQAALTADPDFAAAHAMRALLLRRTGRREAARAESTAAADRLPALRRTLERDRIRLMLEFGGGRDSTVDSLVARILAADPRDQLALDIRALRLFPDAPGAEQALQDLLAVDPNNALAYNLLGYLEARRGEYPQAVDALKTYAFLAPRRANPHDSLGEVLTWIGRYDEAEQELLTALALDPTFLAARLHLGDLLLDRGEVRRGVGILRRLREEAAGQAPRMIPEVDKTVLTGYYAFALYDRAVAWTDSFLTGDHPRDLYFRAVAAATRGDSLQARRLMAGLAERFTGDPARSPARVLQVMEDQLEAILAEVHGDVPAARRAWRRVLNRTADAPPHEVWSVRWRLGRLALAAGEPRRALALADSVLAVNPNRLQGLVLRTGALAALADTAAARATLARLAPLAARADADLPVIRRYRALRDALEPPAAGREAP